MTQMLGLSPEQQGQVRDIMEGQQSKRQSMQDATRAQVDAILTPEQRAKAVQVYLAEKGMDQKLMFWEGKDAKEPMAVTKFCTD